MQSQQRPPPPAAARAAVGRRFTLSATQGGACPRPSFNLRSVAKLLLARCRCDVLCLVCPGRSGSRSRAVVALCMVMMMGRRRPRCCLRLGAREALRCGDLLCYLSGVASCYSPGVLCPLCRVLLRWLWPRSLSCAPCAVRWGRCRALLWPRRTCWGEVAVPGSQEDREDCGLIRDKMIWFLIYLRFRLRGTTRVVPRSVTVLTV